MSISVEQFGQGPDLVLLHGWGMNGAVWHGIAQPLAAHYRLHLVDLHGAFAGAPGYTGRCKGVNPGQVEKALQHALNSEP